MWFRKSKRSLGLKKAEGKDGEQQGGKKGASSNDSSAENNGIMEKDTDGDKFRGGDGEDENGDHNYDDENDEDEKDDEENDEDNDSDGNSISSENENMGHRIGTRLRNHTQKKKGLLLANDVVGLRRSTRTAGHNNVETRNNTNNSKRMLPQGPTDNTPDVVQVVSDSEDNS